MIHSVWNLCRACPGKADEKVHTEYKRNYTWHSNYQPVQQDIIKKPPDLNASNVGNCPTPGAPSQQQHQNASLPASTSAMEPPLPRKKRHPEVAYRNHQVLNFEYPGGDSSDSLDSAASGIGATAPHAISHPAPYDLDDAADFLRARSEERSNSKFHPSGPRSRSADPSLGGRKAGGDDNQEEPVVSSKMTEYQLSFARRKHDGNVVGPQEAGQQARAAAGLPSGLTNSSGSAGLTNRRKGHWPSARTALLLQAGPKIAAELREASARKSISMGAIAHGTAQQNKEEGSKDEAADADHSDETPKRRAKGVTEYKAKFRPFSSYLYVDGNWKKTAKTAKNNNNNNDVWDDDVKGGIVDPDHAWYTEVVERIKKADEYRWRAHGTPLYGGEQVNKAYGPGGPGRQAELWSQVHDRTSLLALSLACSPKSICRGDEKTPDRFKPAAGSHKSPTAAGGPSVAAVHHRRDIRPVSAERKKSPAAEKKNKTDSGPTLPPSRSKAPPKQASPTKEVTPSGSVPVSRPRPVIRPSATPTAAPPTVNGEDGKIWLKPSATPTSKDGEKEEESPAEDAGEALTNGEALSPEMEAETSLGMGGPMTGGERRRPCTLPSVNGVDGQVNGQHYSSPSPLPEPHTGPVPLTTVRSPEEVTGVKSPDPESWTVPLETNKGLEWTDGHTPAGLEAARVKSPPLTAYKSHQLISSPQSSYGQVPTYSPLNSFNEDASETAFSEREALPASLTPHKASSGLVSTANNDDLHSQTTTGSTTTGQTADVLDRARNRLDQFWSKSK